MRYLGALALVFMAATCFAANSVISFTEQLARDNDDYTKYQTESANPKLTILIADNLSHTLTLSSIQTSSLTPIAFLSLRFNGTGTGCIVRPMYTTTKASYVAYPVAASGVFGMGVSTNFKYFNYSSCYN
jgi:hypothetical protein